MKLKHDFIIQDIEETQFLVPVGAESFQGIVRSNQTAAFIVDCLREETTEEATVPLARITLLYESRDGRFCLFEDADGHLAAVDASKLV